MKHPKGMDKDAQPAWPYGALPARYGKNFARYVARGGLVRPQEDAAGFYANRKGNFRDNARFIFFCLILDQLSKESIKGDVAEIGVYKGNTATLLANIARKSGTTAYLFDTFEGFQASDLQGVDAQKNVDAFSDTSLEAVRALVGEENVRFVKGYFPDTASQIPDDAKYCLVHIDCDLYRPIMAALEYFYPRMVPGGFIVVHDYSSLSWNGAEKAVDEFFADKPECVIPLPDASGSIVIRKARRSDGSENWIEAKRTALIQAGWVRGNNLAPLLGQGWSGMESWGVWGIGPTHELRLSVASLPVSRRVHLDADVHLRLAHSESGQSVEVVVEGTPVASWDFSAEKNRGVRTVRLPVDAATMERAFNGKAEIAIVFKPSSTVVPSQLDPAHKDKRPLGMALHRLQLRAE